jgi:glyoxylase-like metal-dependent hydrolase (beta-lactamase superfamily II)
VSVTITSSTLSVNVFTAPGRVIVGERRKPFGEPLGFDPMTSTLIFGEYDAMLVDAMKHVADPEALGDWIALRNRNLETIYITHAHFDHFILLDAFASTRAIRNTQDGERHADVSHSPSRAVSPPVTSVQSALPSLSARSNPRRHPW